MNYMDRLAGTGRTFAPVVPSARITDARSARNAASIREHVEAEDCPDFRSIRSIMRQSHGVCG